jgi:Periplasmic binding protein
MRKWWWAWLGIILVAGPGAGAVHAEYRGGTIRIGVLNDQSGLYADIAGTGSVWIARKAVEDFGAAAKGMKVEILSGDHQNKPDIGLSIARQWFDVDKADAIADVPTSSVALPSTSSSATVFGEDDRLAEPVTLRDFNPMRHQMLEPRWLAFSGHSLRWDG